MPVKQNAATLLIKEQVIHLDGLTLMFRVEPDSSARYRLMLEGEALPLRNYEILFDTEGQEAGGGTALADSCDLEATDKL